MRDLTKLKMIRCSSERGIAFLNDVLYESKRYFIFFTFRLEETLNLVSVPEFLLGTYVKNEKKLFNFYF